MNLNRTVSDEEQRNDNNGLVLPTMRPTEHRRAPDLQGM
jgi:hypothetical protein